MHSAAFFNTFFIFVSASLASQLPADHYLWGEKDSPGNHIPRQIWSKTASVKARSIGLDTPNKKISDDACVNGPKSRNCWADGFSVATDFDLKWPTTGRTRHYHLVLTNGTCSPDGITRSCLLVNGRTPGPTLYADWGDMLSVTVENSMTGNGTSIHWHGIRQYLTYLADGTNGITQCPLAPGDTQTFLFQATQHGTAWYHSHYSAQYGDGIYGAIVINGPASANYDYDLGPYMIMDWFYRTAYQAAAQTDRNLQHATPPPPGDTILINGTNKNANGGGKHSRVLLTQGKKYRLRFINTAVDNTIRVSLDNHLFMVITADLVPIKPFWKKWLLLLPGQRYDVIIHANQTIDNYWFRAEVAFDCASSNHFYGRSIFSYSGASNRLPSTSPSKFRRGCRDEGPLVPWVPNIVPSETFYAQVHSLEVDINVEQIATNKQNIVIWGVNLTAMDIRWDRPTVRYVKEGDTDYPRVYNLIELPREGIWTYWIIQETAGTPVPIPHPIHLHGHDFYILGSGNGVFNIHHDAADLTFNNPPRRDTALLPGAGWLAIAFPTDNPGTWLLHCHIAWHISEGLGIQFLENKEGMMVPEDGGAWDSTCRNWDTYWMNPVWPKTDSGLRRFRKKEILGIGEKGEGVDAGG